MKQMKDQLLLLSEFLSTCLFSLSKINLNGNANFVSNLGVVVKYTQTYVTFKSLVFFVIYEKSNYFALKMSEGNKYILYF
jgi:hypothetical protein